jgi:NAD(P)-dependent dehydrogenase (short-subunit alcohol dehydrogenase family)
MEAVSKTPDPDALNNMIDSWQWQGRSGTTEEVGQGCLFLASDAAGHITGIELSVSGGAELGYGIKVPDKLNLEPHGL